MQDPSWEWREGKRREAKEKRREKGKQLPSEKRREKQKREEFGISINQSV